MKKLRLIPVMLVLAALFSSCTTVITNTADEIRSGRWEAKLSGGSSVSLSFSGDDGVFEISSDDEYACLKISGLCVMDTDGMILCDSADSEIYKFGYKLKNNRLRLTYDGSSITLTRKN